MNAPQSGLKSAPIDPVQQRKSRLTMLGIVAVFILPFVIAPLFKSPAQLSKNNKGVFVQPHVQFDALQLTHPDMNTDFKTADLKHKWTLMYVIPDECSGGCELARNHALYAMRQVRLGMDRRMDRAQQLIVFTSPPDERLAGLIEKEFPGMAQAHGDSDRLNTVLLSGLLKSSAAELTINITGEPSPAGNVLLMSPDGYIFMAYPTFSDEGESILRARDIRYDLKKSIKGDRR